MCGGQSAVRTASLLQDNSNTAATQQLLTARTAADSKDCGRQHSSSLLTARTACRHLLYCEDSLQASPFSLQASPFSVSAFGGQQLAAVFPFD
jgi:hypothetical protein